jgi:hypothetical protein
MGPRMHQLLATLCVTLSFALFTRGGTDPTGGFCVRTLTCCRPTIFLGPILDMVAISRGVASASCEELGWRVNMCKGGTMGVTPPPPRPHFASSVVTSWIRKGGSCPCVNLCPLSQPPIASSPPSLWLKRKKDRETYLETGERVVELKGCCLFFPSKLWQSMAGSHRKSNMTTNKTS